MNDKVMYEGNWKCAGCGTPITKLPFEPRNTENLKCIDCFKKNADKAPMRKSFNNGERPKHEGNWKCGKCGRAITSLPFKPNPERLDQLKCLDCFKAERA